MPKKEKTRFVSRESEIINSRFIVKASVLEQKGAISIMLVITDILDGNFKVQFFRSQEEAYNLVRLLQATT